VNGGNSLSQRALAVGAGVRRHARSCAPARFAPDMADTDAARRRARRDQHAAGRPMLRTGVGGTSGNIALALLMP